MSLTDGWSEVKLLVYREKSAGDRTQPCGEPVLVDREPEVQFPSFTRWDLFVRKSVIHLEVGSGTPDKQS